MKKKYEVKLSRKDKMFLESAVKSGIRKAREITRCRILLLSADGWNNTRICEALSITSTMVRDVCGRYVEEGLESAIGEKKRSGRPEVFDGKERANLTALACSKPPEGHSQWSLRLLADKAVELKLVDDISHTDVGRILKKTKLNLISKDNGALVKSHRRSSPKWKKS